jgi:hypothetical protein
VDDSILDLRISELYASFAWFLPRLFKDLGNQNDANNFFSAKLEEPFVGSEKNRTDHASSG